MKIRCVLILLSLVLCAMTACSGQIPQPSGGQSADDSSADAAESATSLPEPSDTETATASPRPVGFDVREMRVTRDGLSIYGKLYIPDIPGEKLPAVILSHSANMTGDSMNSYCERIASAGWVAYAFDFCGGSKNSRSDGDEADMTVFTEVADLTAVLGAVGELEFVDSRSICLFGTSQGGLVSALVAAECPSAVKGLILFYPGFNIAETAQKFASLLPGAANRPYIATLLDFDVYEHIGSYPGEVLILHGTNDLIVPHSYSQKAAEVYENCDLHLIEGASHGFNKENYAVFGDYDEQTWGIAYAHLTALFGEEP